MADEAVALEEETETSVLDVLATQSEEVEDVVEDEFDDELEDESGDSDVLKARLTKRNKSLKKSKQAIHRLQEEAEDARKEAEEARKQMDELKKQLQQPTQTDTGANKQEQAEALEKWRTEISDNPEKAVDFSNWQMSQLQESVVNVVTSMKQSFDEQIAELKGATNPERIKYKEQMDKLRASNPDFAGLDDDTLLKVVQATSRVKVPRGNVGGGKVTKQPTADEQIEQLKKQFADSFANG
jgi:NADH dehydrogenase/NADH:ubiquinone oxidoreductase subunit G